MIKLVVLFKRRAGIALDAFETHWRTRHAMLVRRLPGLRRYVQSQTLPSGYRKGEPACDGMAELWFDDTAALRSLAASAELATVLADEPNFIDAGSRLEVVTEDVVIKDGPIPADGPKNIELVRRRPDLAPADFHRYWIEHHGPLGASIPQIRRYVQSHTRLSAYRDGREPALDGVALAWFDDLDAMRASATTVAYAATRADEDNFVRVPLAFVITRERDMTTE